jgi:propanediol dehydratase small subunit
MSKPIQNRSYPLSQNSRQELRSASGRPLEELSMEKVLAGEISPQDLRIHAETLRAQAEIARQAGYDRLAANLIRAAELTQVPNPELLDMYTALRPGRSTQAELLALAERLEHQYNAPHCAHFVRQAAEVYLKRGLYKRQPG